MAPVRRGRQASPGRKRPLGVALLLGALWGGAAWAQPIPRRQFGPALELGSATLPMVDGRLQTPCDDAFAYLKSVMDSPNSDLDGAHFEKLLRQPAGISCVEHLEQIRRLPRELEDPLEALADRTSGLASPQEQAAATALCLLAPTFAAPMIASINQQSSLSHPGVADLCRATAAKLPVMAAVRARRDVSGTLLQAALLHGPEGSSVPYWTPPWLAERRDIARSASGLLLAAREQRADGFDGLRRALCTTPETELTDACRQTSGPGETDWKRARGHQSLLVKYGVATAIIGGLATIAYTNRGDDLGRAVAIGSGIVTGAALGVTLTFAVSRGRGDTRGLGPLLLAVPMAALGGIGGGIVATRLSRDPGTPRFVTAAVPLSAAWLVGTSIVIHAW